MPDALREGLGYDTTDFATPDSDAGRAAAVALLRRLREIDDVSGVRHSGIARDIGLLLYEAGADGLSVNRMSMRTGYSGPTIRLVLERLTEAGALATGDRQGKTQFYRLSDRGRAAFDGYVEAVLAFAATRTAPAAAISVAGSPGPARGRPADRPLPRGRYAGAPPAREAAE
jgi:DNA-binding transcriptional ArsR family regulator